MLCQKLMEPALARRNAAALFFRQGLELRRHEICLTRAVAALFEHYRTIA